MKQSNFSNQFTEEKKYSKKLFFPALDVKNHKLNFSY